MEPSLFTNPTIAFTLGSLSEVAVGVAKIPSPRRKVVVLLGGVGTAPPTVEVIAGKSAPVAILGTPVPVLFFKIPVANPAKEVPLIRLTVNAVDPVASPVWVAFVTNPLYKLFTALSPVLVPDKLDPLTAPVAATLVGVIAPAVMVRAGVDPPLDVPLKPLAVATDIAVTVPPPTGVAKIPSPRRKVIVLLGGVGTAPPTVEVITGNCATGNVPVVIFEASMPIASFTLVTFASVI